MKDTSILLIAGVLACGCLSDSSGGSGGTDEAAAVAEALTDGVAFDDGTVIEGAIPDATDETVTISPLDETVILSPGSSTILGVEVEHAEEDSDPIAATLIQFGREGRHFEVQATNKRAGVQASARIDNGIDVDVDVCDGLCNKVFMVEVTESTKLESGAIGVAATRSVQLDCSGAGSEAACSGGDVSGDIPGDVDTSGDQPAARTCSPARGSSCTTDDDCGPFFCNSLGFCAEGMSFEPCAVDTDCADNGIHRCKPEGVCLPKGGTCTEDIHCNESARQVCDVGLGLCTAMNATWANPGDTCAGDLDCETCDTAMGCTSVLTCISLGYCMDGSVGSPCGVDSDCDEGYFCNSDGLCSEGGFGIQCNDDSDCAEFAPSCTGGRCTDPNDPTELCP